MATDGPLQLLQSSKAGAGQSPICLNICKDDRPYTELLHGPRKLQVIQARVLYPAGGLDPSVFGIDAHRDLISPSFHSVGYQLGMGDSGGTDDGPRYAQVKDLLQIRHRADSPAQFDMKPHI